MNEEQRLQRCLDNFSGLFQHILVVDNCSSDRTRELSLELGCECITVKNPGFIETPEVMDKVRDAVTTDYILIASVSEFVPLALLKQYAQVANSASHDVVRAFRQSVTGGLTIPISGTPRSIKHTELRFFKKGAVDYSGNKVHDRGRMVCAPERVLVLLDREHWFFQFRDYDCAHTEIKHAGYNNVLAKQMFDAGVRFSWIKMLYYATKQFGNSYIRFGSWRYGMPGFIQCAYRFYMEIGIWFRIWEWQNGYDGSNLRHKNMDFRESLEREIKENCNAE